MVLTEGQHLYQFYKFLVVENFTSIKFQKLENENDKIT